MPGAGDWEPSAGRGQLQAAESERRRRHLRPGERLGAESVLEASRLWREQRVESETSYLTTGPVSPHISDVCGGHQLIDTSVTTGQLTGGSSREVTLIDQRITVEMTDYDACRYCLHVTLLVVTKRLTLQCLDNSFSWVYCD